MMNLRFAPQPALSCGIATLAVPGGQICPAIENYFDHSMEIAAILGKNPSNRWFSNRQGR